MKSEGFRDTDVCMRMFVDPLVVSLARTCWALTLCGASALSCRDLMGSPRPLVPLPSYVSHLAARHSTYVSWPTSYLSINQPPLCYAGLDTAWNHELHQDIALHCSLPLPTTADCLCSCSMPKSEMGEGGQHAVGCAILQTAHWSSLVGNLGWW